MKDSMSARLRARWSFNEAEDELLALAQQAYGRWEQIRDRLDRDGLMIQGRYGLVLNPLVSAEARARESLMRALLALGLKDVPAPALARRAGRSPGSSHPIMSGPRPS